MLVVFNKIDRVEDPGVLNGLRIHFPDALFVSIKGGIGIDELVAKISDFVSNGAQTVELRLPAARSDLLARVHREGTVTELEYEGDIAHVFASVPKRALDAYREYVVGEAGAA